MIRDKQLLQALDRTYYTFENIFKRCYYPKHHGYKNYGARGIKVAEEWTSFWQFIKDMGLRPPGTTIDRLDPDSDYKPGCCRWATPKQQAQNTRRARQKRKQLTSDTGVEQ